MKSLAAALTVVLLLLGHGTGYAGEGKAERIRLAYLQNDLHQLPCWTAIERGFYKKQGLNVEIAGVFKAGPEEMSGFAGGSLDIGYVGVAPAITAVANKMANVVVLAQVNKEGSAIVVPAHSRINRVSDLRGKTVAVPGYAQMQDLLLRKVLARNGIDAKGVNVIVLKPPEMIGALRTSQIDAFIAWEPYPAQAVAMGIGRVLTNSSEIWKEHPCCVLIGDLKFIKSRPDSVRGMIRAHVQAIEFIRKNPDEAVRIGVRYTGMDENTVRLAMNNIRYDHTPSAKDVAEYAEFLSKLGYIRIEDPLDLARRFIQDTTLGEVLRE